jgi:hypothetical protein
LTDTSAIIVRILAHSDAVLLPIRQWEGRTSTNRWEGLRWLPGRGVPYRVNTSGDEAGRKSGERQLVELAGLGLLVLHRTKTKWPFTRLTDKGETRARQACGYDAEHLARLTLEAVAERTDRNPKTLDQLWLPETALNDGKGWGLDAPPADRRGLAAVETLYLPAGFRGWVIAHSDFCGRAYYCVTYLGWAELDRRPDTLTDRHSPKADPDARRLYEDERDRKLATMEADPPVNPQEIGHLPLTASMSGELVDHADWRGEPVPSEADDSEEEPTP